MEFAATEKWKMPIAIDNAGENPTITCNYDSPLQLEIGCTTIVCTAVDASGNDAVCDFVTEVIGKGVFCSATEHISLYGQSHYYIYR